MLDFFLYPFRNIAYIKTIFANRNLQTYIPCNVSMTEFIFIQFLIAMPLVVIYAL